MKNESRKKKEKFPISNFEMTLKADKKLMFYDSLQHKPPHYMILSELIHHKF